MPRANRYLIDGQIYHLTHRCHNREHLLQFARDREVYRRWLREGCRRYAVAVLGFEITCNHGHLLASASSASAISAMMGLVEGAIASHYNRRKGRRGGFWEGRFHATLIESGEYLWNCLKYIDLNMWRAGAVADPLEWEWCGMRELMGLRQRYRLVDQAMLLRALGDQTLETFRKRYRQEVAATIEQGRIAREPVWTESLAVGSEQFVHAMAMRWEQRRRLRTESLATADGLELWTIRDPELAYSAYFAPKSACKTR